MSGESGCWGPATAAERIRPTPRRKLGESVAEYVERMRETLGYTTTEAAEAAGISRALLYAVEAGVKRVSLPIAEKLGAALGIDPAELL